MFHNVFIGLLPSSLLLTVTSLLEYFAERKRALIELNSIIQQAIVLFENIRRVPDIDNYLDTRILSFYTSDLLFDNGNSIHKRFGEYVTQTIRENYLRDICDMREELHKDFGVCKVICSPESLPLDTDKFKEFREEWRKECLKMKTYIDGKPQLAFERLLYCSKFLEYFNSACEKFDKDFVERIQGCYNDLVYHRACGGRNEDDEPIDIDYKDLLKETFKRYLGFEFVELKPKKQEMQKNILENLNSIIQPYIKIRDWYNSYDFKMLCESFFFIIPFINKSHQKFLEEEIFDFIEYFCERICKCVGLCLMYINKFDYIRLFNRPKESKPLDYPWGRRSSGKTTEDVIKESNTAEVFNYLVHEVYRKIVIHRYSDVYFSENKVSRYLIEAHQYIFKLIKFKKTADVADLKRDLTSDWEDVKKLPKEKAPTFML